MFIKISFSQKNRDIMNAHFHDLKAQMKVMQDSMRKKLTTLTVETNECIQALKAREEKVKSLVLFIIFWVLLS